MYTYYYFKNERTDEYNKKTLFGRCPVYWYTNFQRREEKEQIAVFKKLIELNKDWCETDLITAYSDGAPASVQYFDGEVTALFCRIQDLVCDASDYIPDLIPFEGEGPPL